MRCRHVVIAVAMLAPALLGTTPAVAFWERGALFRCADAVTERERARYCRGVEAWIDAEAWSRADEVSRRGRGCVRGSAGVAAPKVTKGSPGEAVVRRLY